MYARNARRSEACERVALLVKKVCVCRCAVCKSGVRKRVVCESAVGERVVWDRRGCKSVVCTIIEWESVCQRII